MNRILATVRLQLIGWQGTITWGWTILAFTFAVNLAIFAIIGDEIPDEPITGALASIYIIAFIQSIISISQLFPHAMGMSVTRRAYYLAASLLLVLQSLASGIALYLLRLIEDATGGWGLSMRFFGLPFLVQDNPLLQILIYTVPFIVLGFAGISLGLLYKRWSATGMYILTIATLLVGGGLVSLVTWQRWWMAIGRWLVDQPPAGLFAGWPALLALVLAGTGYLTIRRAVP